MLQYISLFTAQFRCPQHNLLIILNSQANTVPVTYYNANEVTSTVFFFFFHVQVSLDMKFHSLQNVNMTLRGENTLEASKNAIFCFLTEEVIFS